MLNETVSEFLDRYLRDLSCGRPDCPCAAEHYRTLLAHLYGRGILDMKTARPMGRRIKQAIREAHGEKAPANP